MNGTTRPIGNSAWLVSRTAWLALALIAAVFLAYTPAWRAGFIWDDDLHVTANPAIVGPQGLKEIWTTPAANYFPLTMTSFWVLHALCGLNPLSYHLINVAFHATSALLLWAVLRRLRLPGAWLGAAWWALHPVQVESVAWISELKNTQSAAFFLLALWFYVRRIEREHAGGTNRVPPHRSFDYAAALGCAILAVLSKSSTVMLPVILLLCRWWRARRWQLRTAVELIPFLLVSVVVSGWTIWEQKYSSGAVGADWSHSFTDRVVTAGRVPWFYLGKLVWPDPLIFIYPRWQIGPNPIANLLPGLALLIATAWLWWRSDRSEHRRGALFALLSFLALLFPVLGFFDVYFFRFSFVGDHFQYLASMAAIALAAAGVATLPRRPQLAAGAALAATLALLTWRQAQVYRSDLTLFSATVAANPDAWMAQSNLSAAFTDVGRLDDAITSARRALALRPDYAEAENNLGRALTLAGRSAEAVAHLQRAIALQPDYGEAHTNLGIALAALGGEADAIRAFEGAVRLKPHDATARYNLGVALANANRTAEALPHLAEAVRLQPGHAHAEMMFGLALTAAGRFPAAMPHLERAVRLAPDSAEIHTSFGRALAVAGRLDEAQGRLRRALELNPNSGDAHLNLALVLQHLGRNAEAAEHFQAAKRANTGK